METSKHAEALESLLTREVFAAMPGAEEAYARGLVRTQGALRMRSRRKRAGQVFMVMAALALGWAGGWWSNGTGPAAGDAGGTVLAEAPAAESAEAARPVMITEAVLADVESLPILLSNVTEEEQRRLLREAGDRYLYAWTDPGRALNCYRRLLALLPESEARTVTGEDSWLLAQLKRKQQKKESNT